MDHAEELWVRVWLKGGIVSSCSKVLLIRRGEIGVESQRKAGDGRQHTPDPVAVTATTVKVTQPHSNPRGMGLPEAL